MANESVIQVPIHLNAQSIEDAIVRAIVDSSIGKQMQIIIERKVEELKSQYYRSLETALDTAVKNEVNRLVLQEHSEIIRKVVKERITEEKIEAAVTAFWNKIDRGD